MINERREAQNEMEVVMIEQLVPQDHLLRKIDKYIDNKVDLDKKLKDDGDIYYYKVVNKGLFKKKEVYIINMYTEKVYLIDNDGIKDY